MFFLSIGYQDTSNPDPLAKAHLDLLSQLIGASVTKNEFRLNLFKNDTEEEYALLYSWYTNLYCTKTHCETQQHFTIKIKHPLKIIQQSTFYFKHKSIQIDLSKINSKKCHLLFFFNCFWIWKILDYLEFWWTTIIYLFIITLKVIVKIIQWENCALVPAWDVA